jgi:sulfur-carrier protein adenylyltransferase/sulfurtransferase
MKSDSLSDKELRIFKQQINLSSVGAAGQERIQQCRILVIGAGGKGTSALRALVASGAGNIGICDNYLVEEDTLPRQSLYGENDIGKQKAIISKQRLSELSALCKFEIHNICLSEANILPIFSMYDIIMDATDNFPAHYLINDAALILGKPFIFGLVVKNTCLLSVFNHNGGPSLRCLYPSLPRNTEKYTDSGIPAVNFLYNIAGSMMAHEVIRIVLGLDSEINGKLLQFKLADYSIFLKPIRKNPENFINPKFR